MSGRTSLAVGLVALAVTATGCGDSSPNAPADDAGSDRIAVVASTNVWGSLVAAIGGQEVSVTSIIADPSADPHSYEDKPGNAVAVSAARLLIYNGGGYDDFFAGLADTSGKNARKVVAFDVAGKGPSGSTNEHVWYDLPTVKKVADTLATELGALAPAKKDTFTGNATAFDTKIDALITKVSAIGENRPGAAASFTEPVPEYLIDLAGLHNATPAEFSEAVEEETDPPAAAVAELTNLLTGHRVAVLINNAQAETRLTNQVVASATAAGIPVVNMTETLPAGVTDYVDWMTAQVDDLSRALARS
jgi:zinc/manganese transport system substrate-binding protein